MSTLKPTVDAALFDETSVARPVGLLAEAARRVFASVEAKLKADGFGITCYEPIHANAGY
jgi:hypothetical protein